MRKLSLFLISAGVSLLLLALLLTWSGQTPPRRQRSLMIRGAQETQFYRKPPFPPPAPHPRHEVKVWMTRYYGRTFQVVQLPRCQHIEAFLSYHPQGETKEEAKQRLRGMAVCTGSFHNPQSMSLADFFQRRGNIVSPARTGRWFFASSSDGRVSLSNDYAHVKRNRKVDALALGQRIVPLNQDGFSLRFMNEMTDRMAMGLSKRYLYIVQGRSDIWKLAKFMEKKLPCDVAVNTDGGHVVRGRAPVHIVFRWRKVS